MKKLLLIFVSMFIMFACSQEDVSLSKKEMQSDAPVLTTTEAQLKFAKILSSAVSKNVEVRNFLKKEALAQFDNDYDVFYPFVKNKIVANSQSFRDILLSYCENDNELTQIEQSQILLNILVPDLTLFGDFCAKSWNTDDKEIAVICRDDNANTLYENGEKIGYLKVGDIPAFPCLVIKNNERMKVSNANTRSGETTYEFANDAFDGSTREAQTRHSEYDQNLEETQVLDKYINGSELPSIVKDAWTEFKNTPNAYQRDNIYYGITKANKPGFLNRNIREKLYRFRVNYKAFGKISNTDDTDFKLVETTQAKRYLTNEEILQRVWTGGNFEFRFKTYIAGEDGTAAMENMLTFSVSARDVFSIEKVHVKHKNSTLFRESKNTYSVNPDNLRSKWIYPEKLEVKRDNQVFLLPWDLYNKSLTIYLFAEEYDPSGTKKETKTIVNEFASKGNFELSGGGSIGPVNLTAKAGYGFSSTKTVTSSTEVTTTLGSDNLGTLSFLFYDPIIRAESNGTYKLYDVSSGDMEATLLPMNLLSK